MTLGDWVIGVLNKLAVLIFVLPAQSAGQAELIVDMPGGVTVERVVVRILLRIKKAKLPLGRKG